MINLTQKERYLLEDQKSHEEMCIKKYTSYSNQAKDQELKQIFQRHAQQEQQHLDTINQILNGQMPNVQQNQQQNQQQQNMQNMQNMSMQNMQAGMENQTDATLCQDVLATEKYVSSTYNTAVFEFSDSNLRQILNHIQSEEQKHGEDVFHYMQQHGMYNVK